MSLAEQIKPISYLKANASKIARTLAEKGEPLIITQNGEAKMVVQDIHSYERTQETLALLKLLSLSRQQITAGQVEPAEDVIARLRKKHRDH